MNEKLELILREKYADLRKSEKRAADYLLQYEGDGRTLTLEQFAAGANVSQPTVLRFLRALGYKGFKDFRYVLAQKEPEEKENGYFLYGSTVMEGDTISELPAKLIGTSIGQLKDTLKNLSAAELEKAVTAITKARKIAVYYVENSACTAAIWSRNWRIWVSTVTPILTITFRMSALPAWKREIWPSASLIPGAPSVPWTPCGSRKRPGQRPLPSPTLRILCWRNTRISFL